jgi:ABC-type glycerol-3-phosphate transport system substrate-binding protein
MTTRWRFPAALLLIGSLSLSACGGEAATSTTVPLTERTPAKGGAATATTGSAFDPAAYKKNEVDLGATLRVASWGDTSEQQVNRDALSRFNQVYPDIKITYEPQPSGYGIKLVLST